MLGLFFTPFSIARSVSLRLNFALSKSNEINSPVPSSKGDSDVCIDEMKSLKLNDIFYRQRNEQIEMNNNFKPVHCYYWLINNLKQQVSKDNI